MDPAPYNIFDNNEVENPNLPRYYDYDSATESENDSVSNSSNDDFEDTENSSNSHYILPFSSDTQYIFVNACLTLMHGNLPSYAYFQGNDEIEYFWNDLEDEYFNVIYYYLLDNHLINYDGENEESIYTMKVAVLNFVDTYFV